MKNTTTVYGKPSCVQCNATYQALDQQGVSYRKIDVSQNDEALAYIQSLGYTQAPVVVTATEHWSGFRPDKIGSL